ncbi:hypothetical protein Tco_0452339 [Tanacetum coccineum]
MVVPALETATPPQVPLAPHQIPTEMSMAQNQNKQTYSTWMAFEGNTRDFGSFGEETDEIIDLHQDSPRSIVLRAWRRHRRHKATPS